MSCIRRASLIGLVLVSPACGTDPGTGTVEVTTVSEGQDLDSDGYTVHLRGAESQAIGANQTIAIAEVPAGDQEIRLAGVRGNCAVQQAHPRLIRVTAGETFRLHFEVQCARAPLLGRMVYSSVNASAEREVNGDLYTMTPDGSGQQRITSSLLVESYASIAPDGARILFQGADFDLVDVRTDFDIYVINADGTGLVALTSDAVDDLEPAWSPDGSVIAFIRSTPRPGGSSDTDIYLINPDGSGLVNLSRSPGVWENWPRWSPDGTRIMYQGSTETSGGIYVMHADGTRPTLLTNVPLSASMGTWSPDGAQIVFQGFVPEKEGYDLFLVDADGSNQVRLTELPGSTHNPSWPPPGGPIVFQYFPPDYSYWGPVKSEVYAVQSDGTELTNISRTPSNNESLGANPRGP